MSKASSKRTTSLTKELRRLHAEAKRFIDIEMSLEVPKGEPGYRRYRSACRNADKAQAKLDALCRSILARPVHNWADAALIAEAARAQAQPSVGGGLALVDESVGGLADLEQASLGHLLTAVLVLSGGRATALPMA